MAWGRGWVGDTPGFNGDLNAVLRSIKAKTVFIYNPRDQLHLPHHIDSPAHQHHLHTRPVSSKQLELYG